MNPLLKLAVKAHADVLKAADKAAVAQSKALTAAEAKLAALTEKAAA